MDFNYLLTNLLAKYPELDLIRPDLEAAYSLLSACYRNGGLVLTCGNGGSASDSEHIAGELMKGFNLSRPIPSTDRQALLAAFPHDGEYLAGHLQGALPAISLVSQIALITAFANDVAPDMIFAQQVYGYGRPGDVLLALSVSGVSISVLNAVKVARARGLKTIGFTGRDGGQLKDLCDVALRIPWDSTPDVQERHLPIYHALCAGLEAEFFGGR